MAGGWCHVTARGNERKRVFRDDKDRGRFLELLEEWVERFSMRLHAYVLMDNHYHLLAETTQPNLGAAMQWLQVSYTVGFNRRHRRVGLMFQGRYKVVVASAEVRKPVAVRYAWSDNPDCNLFNRTGPHRPLAGGRAEAVRSSVVAAEAVSVSSGPSAMFAWPARRRNRWGGSLRCRWWSHTSATCRPRS